MYGIFYIPVNFAFNLSHYVTNAICTTQVKKRVKKRKKKKKGYEKFASRVFEPAPSE